MTGTKSNNLVWLLDNTRSDSEVDGCSASGQSTAPSRQAKPSQNGSPSDAITSPLFPTPRLHILPDGRDPAPARTIEVMPLSSLRVKKPVAKPEITDQIGRHLRSVYNDVLVQPIPDRFLDLLKVLDDVEPQAPEKKGAK